MDSVTDRPEGATRTSCGPSPRMLSILHRDHPGAFVSFAHKPRGGKFVQPVSIRAREIAELLPGFARLLLEDSYFTLNGQREDIRHLLRRVGVEVRKPGTKKTRKAK